MEEGGAASQVPQNEKRFFDRLRFVPGEEDIIQKETEPVDKRPNRPYHVEEQEKDGALAGETGRCVLRSEERAIESAPEETKVIVH